MEALILTYTSALRVVRHARCMRSPLGKLVSSRREQTAILNAASSNTSMIDADYLERLGIPRPSNLNKLHVLIGRQSAHRHCDCCVEHMIAPNRMPGASLVHLAANVYCTSPVFTAYRYTNGRSLAEAFALLSELMGTYSLPAEITDDIACGNVGAFASIDAKVEYGVDPVVTKQEIEVLAKKTKSRADASFVRAAGWLAGPSASPMETILLAMLGLPKRYGGFGCFALPGGLRPNYKVVFNGHARQMSSGVPYAVCDIYAPSAHTDIEYNGAYHDAMFARKHDAARNNGLRGMGIKLIEVDARHMFDLVALEAFAMDLYKSAGRQFEYRVDGYRTRQANLLTALYCAMGLRPH